MLDPKKLDPKKLDPRKLLVKLPRFDQDKPFRYLGRRLVQAMAEAATANLVLGKRSAPGRYLVLRLADTPEEREQWEQQWSESRTAIYREIEREAQVREIRLRSALEVDLFVLTAAEADAGEDLRSLSTLLDEGDLPAVRDRLREEREVILPRRARTLLLETAPAGAQAYVDHKPVGVTPCQVDDLPEGEHILTFSCPGFLPFETTYRVEPGRTGQKLRFSALLEPEPPMGVVEVITFPPGARVMVGEETRDAPARFRLPIGPTTFRVEAPDFAPETLTVDVLETPDTRPHPLLVRLRYAGADQDEIVGRLIIYDPEAAPPPPADPKPDPIASNLSSFFREIDPAATLAEDPAPARPTTGAEPEIIADLPLRRGIVLIGRDDPSLSLRPDVRLFDPTNSVTRGCHAWLWVYADRSTGAAYNTFLVGNNSPAGVWVDGQLVTETRRLSDDAEIVIGNFRMRVCKTTPKARVEVAL